jgi:hypothetical protein
MKAAGILLICLLCLNAACLSYKAARIEVDAPLEVEAFESIEVGETTFSETVFRMGPPDGFAFRWTETGERYLRIEYAHARGRSTDLSIAAPVDEVSRYNTGVRFFLLFFRVLRGGSVIPRELSELDVSLSAASRAAGLPVRYSELKSIHRGRPQRFSALPRRPVVEKERIDDGPLSPLVPLILQGSGEGLGRIRLEFDARGVLVTKELRSTLPGTSLADYLQETILK